jgi:DNA-binding transcriptional regulator GbsR (MarR family)
MTEATARREQDRDDLLWFVEQFALLLTEAGMPRMAARVFAYVLAEDADEYTAADLATGLRVSAAAISGSTRYLVDAGLLSKERRPGARSDHFRIDDHDVWSAIFSQRAPMLRRWEECIAEGVELLGDDTPGGRRLAETKAYFHYLSNEFPKLLAGWRRYRDSLFG